MPGSAVHIRHLVCTDAFAGVERYLTYVGVELARRGHHVEVVGGEPTAMRAALEPAGVRHVSASSVPEVARASLRLGRADVVHSHMTAADVAAAATRVWHRRPVVSTLHFAHRRGHSPATRLAYRSLRPFLTAEVAISDYVAEVAGPGLTVIRNGIPDPGNPAEPGAREPLVVVAQRLEAEKDTSVVIRAWRVSGLGDRGWRLQILGDGSERPALQRLVASLGLEGSIEMPGRVADVHERLRRASIFVATAPAEPFGLAVVEAMASALPVLAAAGGAHRETVGEATPEGLFRAGDSARLGTRLGALAASAEQRLLLGNRGRAHFLAELTVERHVDHLEGLYRSVTSSRGGTPR